MKAVVPHIEMSQIKQVGFLTLNNFSLVAFGYALEILRMANYANNFGNKKGFLAKETLFTLFGAKEETRTLTSYDAGT